MIGRIEFQLVFCHMQAHVIGIMAGGGGGVVAPRLCTMAESTFVEK